MDIYIDGGRTWSGVQREATPAFEFWAKRTDERGREIDVTVIAYGRSLTEALTRVLALGVHRDVVVYA